MKLGWGKSDEGAFVEVMKIPHPALLPVVKSLLDEEDVQYYVKNETTQGLFGLGQVGAGFNILTGPPALMVEAGRADDVRQMLEDLLREDDVDA